MDGIGAGFIVLLLLVAFALIVLFRTVRIVPQQTALIIERLGRYARTLEGGIHFLVPFVDKVRANVDLREQVVSFPPQPVITTDNLVVNIDTVIYYSGHRRQVGGLRDRQLHPGHRAAHRHHAAQRHRLARPRADADQPRPDQRPAARRARRGHRQVGHPRQPGRAQGHRPAARRSRSRWRSR